MFKRLTAVVIAILLLMGVAFQADALYGLNKHWAAVYDESGNVRTDVDSITIYTAGTTTAATIYSDDIGTSTSNPIVTGISDGVFEYYGPDSTYDILIQAGTRAIKLTSWTTSSKHEIVIDSQVSVGKSIRFSPGQFVAVGWGGSTVIPLTNSSKPRWSIDNSLIAIEWDDGDESYAQVTFRVPDDYHSGGAFRVMTDYDSGSDNPPVHFRVYVNADGSAWDSATTAQTAVDPAGTAGTPEVSTLSIATDFASLAAGNVVTLQVSRSNQDSSTADLELYYAEFYYNAKQ